MQPVNTKEWKDFVIGDLFEKLKLDVINPSFSKSLDVSETRTEEFCLPLVNAKHGNNGIMYYGRPSDFETASMTIDIVQNGAIATGDVYPQPQETGVLWDAYLIKLKQNIESEYVLMFLSTVIEKAIKDRFSYDDKCTWDKAKVLTIKLPIDANGDPDWDYMETYMSSIFSEAEEMLDCCSSFNNEQSCVDTTSWKEFIIGDLFDVSRPVARSQSKYLEGTVPFVATSTFNNGITAYCEPRSDEILDKGGCITVSPLDGAAFYQPDDFLGRGGAGSAIIMLRCGEMTELSGLFLATTIKTSLTKYSYSDQLNKQTIVEEAIMLPTTSDGKPDWNYMEAFMQTMMDESDVRLGDLQKITV